MAQASVVQDREKYIGGSDIPIILGISPFKKRFDLLLEKAGLQKNEFSGNEYTEYGNVLEPKIREYINNNKVEAPYKEDKIIKGNFRYHDDGFNGEKILEIKTTSQIHEKVSDYKVYLSQLLFGLWLREKRYGDLAVYERPVDFNTEFEEERLHYYNDIDINDHKEFVEQIIQAVEQFEIDLEKVKANPFITEEELQPKELIELSDKVVELENELANYKELEKQYKDFKSKLYDAMELNNVKQWTTNNGVKITRVESKPDTTEVIKEFNAAKFQEENPEIHQKYIEEKTITKKGKSGYIVITLPKESK